MGYIEKSSGDGERLLGRATFHWLYSVKAYAFLVVPLIVLLLIRVYATDPTRQGLIIAGLLLLFVGLLTFLRMIIVRWTTEIGVTSHRFVEKGGWLSLRTNEIALPNIEGVRVTQGFWGRIWNYGHLRIEGTGVDAVQTPTIADPVGFRRAIETAKGIKA
jgi:uncharacterized membrane protein YdbT with pleckstrin-like domain